MKESVIRQIQYLCSIISYVEWSGLLFYSQQGTIEKPEEMVITLEDILPMDKGSVASTEFEYDERYVNYVMGDEKRMDWRHGMIHSHNNMGVFFSGTDHEDLKKNSKAHNYYLSVVVNNKMEMIGKVAFTAEVVIPKLSAPFYALNEKGEKYFVEKVDYCYKKEKLYTYDCNLEYQIPQNNFNPDFISAVDYIMNPPVKHKYVNSMNQRYSNPTGTQLPLYNEKDYGYNYPFMSDSNRKSTEKISDVKELNIPTYKKPEEKSFLEKKVEGLLVESFGYHKSVDFEEVLEDLQTDIDDNAITPEEIVDSFISSYYLYFAKTFPNREVDDPFIYNIALEMIKQYVIVYPFVEMLYNTIEDGI